MQDSNQPRRSNRMRWIIIAVAVFMVLTIVIPALSGMTGAAEINISRVVEMAQNGELQRIGVTGDRLDIHAIDGRVFRSRKETSVSIFELLERGGVETSVQIDVREESRNFFSTLFGFLPIILIGVLIFWMMRRGQGGISQITRIGRSRAWIGSDPLPSSSWIV